MCVTLISNERILHVLSFSLHHVAKFQSYDSMIFVSVSCSSYIRIIFTRSGQLFSQKAVKTHCALLAQRQKAHLATRWLTQRIVWQVKSLIFLSGVGRHHRQSQERVNIGHDILQVSNVTFNN